MNGNRPFDPEGMDFDYKAAIESGGRPDESGHWGSLDPRTGMVLKGRQHETFYKTVEAERQRGNTIVKKTDGRYYSVPRVNATTLGTPMNGNKQFDYSVFAQANATPGPERGQFDYSVFGQALAAEQPKHIAPKFDAPATFREIDDKINRLEAEAMAERESYNDSADSPIRSSYMHEVYGTVTDPDALEDFPLGKVGEVREKKSGAPAALPPEYEFKSAYRTIMATEEDAVEREKQIDLLKKRFQKSQYDEAFAPVQQFYTNKLIEEHSEEKHGSYIAEWIDAWDRGVAQVSSAATQVVGAKDWARAYHLATQSPELAPSVDQDWVMKAINVTGETGPYMVATLAAAAATGGAAGAAGVSASAATGFGAMGSGVVSFGIEGNSAYQGAVDAGVDDTTARQIGFGVGLTNAAIEMAGGGGSKYFKKAVQRGFKDRMKMMGAWTLDRVRTALGEALEEAGQELVSITGERTYRNIDGKELVDRVIAAGGAGFALGGALDLTLGTASRATMRQAEQNPTVPTKGGQDQSIDPASLPRRERSPRPGPAERGVTDEGTLAVLGLLRETGVAEPERIKLSNEVRTLADEIKEDHITEEEAIQFMRDAGIKEDQDPATIRVIGRNFRDSANRAVINLYEGHDASTVLHEVAEDYYKTVYGENADTEQVQQLRREYEERTGDYREGNNREWLADLAVDYAVHNRIHKRAGSNLRRMFNKFREVYKQLLARVHTLRNNISSGNVSVELQSILEQPFKEREQVQKTKLTPEQQSQRAKAKHLVKDHIRWFKAYQERPSKKLMDQIDTVRRRHAELMGMDIAEGRPFVPPEIGAEGMEIEFKREPSFKLIGPEAKLVEKHGSTLAPKAAKAYVTTDGQMVPVSQDHEETAQEAGSSLRRLVNSGVTRLYRMGNQAVVEVAEKPITDPQAERIQQWIGANFDPTQGMLLGFSYGKGGEDHFMYTPTQRADIPKIVGNMRDLSGGKAKTLATYKLQRGPNAKPTYGQLAQGHMLAELLGQGDKDRREQMRVLTDKISMADMTYGEAEAYIGHLHEAADARGIRYGDVKNTGDVLAYIIDNHSKVKAKPINGIRTKGLKRMWEDAKKGVSGYLQYSTRIERMLHALNGYEHGMLYNSVFREVRAVSDVATLAGQQRALDLQQFLEGNYDLPTRKSMLSGRQEEVVEGVFLDPAERMTVYMLSKNEHGMQHLQQGHKLSAQQLKGTLAWIKKNRPEEIQVADWMLDQYDAQYDRLAHAHFLATGETLTKEDFYSPIYLRGVELEQQTDFVSELLDQKIDLAQPHKIGETIERTRRAGQPVRLDAFENYLHNTSRVERYIAMAPTVSKVAKILNNRNFKAALNDATYGYGSTILNQWLKDSTRGYASDVPNLANKIARGLRRNSMVYVLGFKATSSLRQTLSIFPAMAIDPMMVPLVVKNMATHPPFSPAFRGMADEVYSKSAMMKARSWDRVEHLIKSGKSAYKKLLGKATFDEKALSMIKFFDRHTTIHAWKAAYDVATARGLDEKGAVEFADNVIERTQPMGSAIDLPAFFRGGFWSKLMTTFENQVNQNFNFWKHDIIGAKTAGKIGWNSVAYRLLMSYLIPAFFLGLAGRGRLPDDAGELVEDMATYPIAGFVLFGRWINAAIKGFGSSGGIIDVGPTEIGRGIEAASRGQFGSAAVHTAKGVSAVTGTVPHQAFVTASGIHDLATGETDDLRRLLWTQSQFEPIGYIHIPVEKDGKPKRKGLYDRR